MEGNVAEDWKHKRLLCELEDLRISCIHTSPQFPWELIATVCVVSAVAAFALKWWFQ